MAGIFVSGRSQRCGGGRAQRRGGVRSMWVCWAKARPRDDADSARGEPIRLAFAIGRVLTLSRCGLL